ncbi:heavy-metal-associated domain-containing protein [Streptomyces sp. HC44]|uniref:Heavy-metal-associated domain-containing protein n=1 Tax=Streptomyces scabichelini TaxID=2711217 RepID=A0A6G4VEV8_9ACTN|nr:heavy-metal-associated domain-containing protein [Streptomyces scabichelini]NGO12672.1 heavy-metal-associated domain-containing protein [Streptomyces scabichelini]
MAQKSYTVTGMSCEHCAASITEEVSDVPGVTDVVVDLASNVVTVHATELDDDQVRAAIVEAGYGVDEPASV